MNLQTTQRATSAASEINRLHAEVEHSTQASCDALHGALAAAWRAGHLLIAEKQRVLRRMGGGAWLLWLERHFEGAPRTAQKYMKLAKSVDNAEFLRGLSLRQAYLRLGIATEPKERTGSAHVSKLPDHLRFAGKLVVALRADQLHGRISAEQAEAYRRDLRPLYGLLRGLFENQPANLSTSTLTNKL